MKRYLIILLILFITLNVHSQVFKSAKILKPGVFTLGVNPVFYSDENIVFLHGKFGLHKLVDLGVKYGFFEGENYLGANLGLELGRIERFAVSMFAGLHKRKDIGADFGGLVSFPVGNYATIFTGVDIDLIYGRQRQHYTWIPLGTELMFTRNASLILEVDIPMSHFAWIIAGGGMCVYF